MKGYVHIYCGDGKGKTSASIGLAVRAAGRGRKVLFVRFLKKEDSGEVEVLRGIPGIVVTPCDREFGFVFRMKPEQRKEAKAYFTERFRCACKESISGGNDVLVLDELVGACNSGMVPEEEAVEFLKNRPDGLEVVLTGRDPSGRLIELADYVSEIRAEKHPFRQGVGAREGIEY